MVHCLSQVGILGAALALAPLLVLIAQKRTLSGASDGSPTPKGQAKEGLPFSLAATYPKTELESNFVSPLFGSIVCYVCSNGVKPTALKSNLTHGHAKTQRRPFPVHRITLTCPSTVLSFHKKMPDMTPSA